MARLHLVRRVSAAKLVPTVAGMCGAHAQILSTVPLALAARVTRLTRDRVHEAVAKDHSLVKTWAMRGTLHVLAAEDLPLYCAAQRTRDQYMDPSFLRYLGLELADMEAVLDAIPRALDGRSLTREELANELLRLTKRPHLEARLRSGWGELLKPAAFRGLLCFGPQRERSVTFVRPDQWIGRWQDFDTEDALRQVFRRFLSVYAPTSRAEVARWWGFRPPEAGRVLKLLEAELVEVEVGGSKRWVLNSDLMSLKSARPVEGVRLLPSFDQLLVMSAPHKEAIVDETFANRIYTPRIAVWSLPAVLVDGRARASWKLDRKRDRAIVRVEAFEKLGRASRTALAAEVEGLSTTLGTEAQLELIQP